MVHLLGTGKGLLYIVRGDILNRLVRTKDRQAVDQAPAFFEAGYGGLKIRLVGVVRAVEGI
jgi:hypothetical protein